MSVIVIEVPINPIIKSRTHYYLSRKPRYVTFWCQKLLWPFSHVLPFITLGEPNRDHQFQQFKLLRAYLLLREPCVNSKATLWFHYSSFQEVFTEPLPSKWSYASHYYSYCNPLTAYIQYNELPLSLGCFWNFCHDLTFLVSISRNHKRSLWTEWFGWVKPIGYTWLPTYFSFLSFKGLSWLCITLSITEFLDFVHHLTFWTECIILKNASVSILRWKCREVSFSWVC
jgi:hypothetical protein